MVKYVDRLDADFNQTCRIIFGREIGGLDEFEPYLKEMMFPHKMVRSSVSGKPVMVSSKHYSEDAAYASQDEISGLKFSPLNINDMKDIDSLFEAAQERALYCGSKLFGKNMNVSEGDNIADCSDVLHSHDIYNSKYVAFSSIGRVSQSIYGISIFWNCSHAIRCSECTFSGARRCFECYYSTDISDSYFTFNCSGCSNCMFSFNLRGKSRMIGNLQLSKERYLQLKEKLVGEMAERLKKDKRLFSMGDIAGISAESGDGIEEVIKPGPIPKEIETAFGTTSKLLLGKEHGSEKLSSWLMRRAIGRKKIRGADGLPTYKVESVTGKQVGRGKLVNFDAALKSASEAIRLDVSELPSLDEIAKRAGEKAVFSMEFFEGQNRNTGDTVLAFNSTDVYRLWWSLISKHSAFSTVVTESEHVFGGWGRNIFSRFCISCDNMTYCSNSFECDSCYQCRDCYFCHNCENVEEGIFCFNAKGLRYAVLNQEVGKEEHGRVKRMLLGWINSELDKKGRLDVDIFKLSQSENRKIKRS